MTTCASGSETLHPATPDQKTLHLGGGAEGRSHAKRPEGQSLATSRRGALLLERSTPGSLAPADGLAPRAASRVCVLGRDRGLASGPRHEPDRSSRDRRARRIRRAFSNRAQRSPLWNLDARNSVCPWTSSDIRTPNSLRSLSSWAGSGGPGGYRHGSRITPHRSGRIKSSRRGDKGSCRFTRPQVACLSCGSGRISDGNTASMAVDQGRSATPGRSD